MTITITNILSGLFYSRPWYPSGQSHPRWEPSDLHIPSFTQNSWPFWRLFLSQKTDDSYWQYRPAYETEWVLALLQSQWLFTTPLAPRL